MYTSTIGQFGLKVKEYQKKHWIMMSYKVLQTLLWKLKHYSMKKATKIYTVQYYASELFF